jgi:hypothetical protein
VCHYSISDKGVWLNMVSVLTRSLTEPSDQKSDDAGPGNASHSAYELPRSEAAAHVGRDRKTASKQVRDWRLDRSLFAVVCVVLGFLFLLLCTSLYVQYSSYHAAIVYGQGIGVGLPPDHASVISYVRAFDFAVVKTSALFLAYALVFVGALYVLRVGEATYELSAGTKAGNGSFQTSSPGLVLVTLGVILIALVLNSKSALEYSRAPLAAPASAPRNSLNGAEEALQSETADQRFQKPPLSSMPPQSSIPPERR